MSIINETEKFAVLRLGPDRMIGYPHAERVRKNALALQKIHGGNRERIEIAAILHDIGFDGKNIPTHAEESANIAGTFLKEQKCPMKKRQAIMNIIRRHTLSDWVTVGAPETVEEKILFDSEVIERLSMHGFLKFVLISSKLPYKTRGIVYATEKFIDENYKAIFFRQTKEMADENYLLFKTVLSQIKEELGI